LPRAWLGKLVLPLHDPRIGASTTYRWVMPSGKFGTGAFASALASTWNAAVATMLGRARENFCWGGGTAIRRKTFDAVHVPAAWSGAVSDDLAMTCALEEAGKPITFCPECLAPTLHPWTGSDLLEFTNRQIVITRGYSPTLVYAAISILVAMMAGDPWMQLLLMALVIPLLAATKGAMRTMAVG